MDPQGSSPLSNSSKVEPFLFDKLGDIDAAAAARVAAASGDIAMIIDRDGVIRDMVLNNEDLVREGAGSWLDQRWSDTVTLESRHKIDELLRDALSDGRSPWREVNQLTPTHNAMMMRYLAVDAGRDGRVVAIGRDDRATAVMQQRLMEAQQLTERDYSRLREAEFRYRLLFQMSGEAVIIVDNATKKIIEANPAAEAIFNDPKPKLAGELFVKIFDSDSQEEAASLLVVARAATRANCARMHLFIQGRGYSVSASMFRQDRATQCLMRLTPLDQGHQIEFEHESRLQTFLDRIPDAFLITDESLTILDVNTSFLDLVRLPTRERVIGESLNYFLGRAGLERNILIETLREHGSVRNFSTVMRNQFGQPEDVEISAIARPDGAETRFSFTMRIVRRRSIEPSNSNEPRRSAEQLTELIGRVKLKDMVRESSDIVERLCIEAALDLTKNNRASAAELLGLSRQSLYSKLHRFGLGNLGDDDD